jgi:peptide/nickel transport system permease protein
MTDLIEVAVEPGIEVESSAARRRPSLLVVLCVGYLALVVFAALLPGLLTSHNPTDTDLYAVSRGPSGQHWFGTDQLGRDVYTRVVYGARLSLSIGVVSTAIGAVIGGLLGLIAGYFGGAIDALLMRLSDVMLAFPGVMLALAIIAARGRNTEDLIAAIGIASVPEYARLMRGQVSALRELPYMEAARASGSRRRVQIFVHLLPNALPPLVVFATIGVGLSLLAASGLSFLGLGPQPPAAEWGSMLADARNHFDQWWMAVFPGVAIALTVLSINIVGQRLRGRVARKAVSR